MSPPVLRTLHWLPVKARIHYKTLVLPIFRLILKPYTPTPFCHLWSLGPPTPTGGQLQFSRVQTLLCPGTPMVGPASP
ncbi:unnamed protein product [Oncorhynchus mykiss]|uniref:Uncharacterized protein n=1 Tax=Oncorhynchus mykiss TaxID=8022 RepID=A0A060ZRH8_ONCMY|nr:unnamed protein product [Oncorhynchus mykiss]